MKQVRWDITVRRVPEDTTRAIAEVDDWVRFNEEGLTAVEVTKLVEARAQALIARLVEQTQDERR